MMRPHPKPFLLTIILAAACGSPPETAGAVAALERADGTAPDPCAPRLESAIVPMPAHVRTPRSSGFVQDASSGITFEYTDAFTDDDEIGYVHTDGSGFRCISCDPAFDGHPALDPGDAFPDGRRFLAQSGENNGFGQLSFYVVECTPSIEHCAHVGILPIEGFPGGPKLQDRVPKLSPDGNHIVWTRIRTDGYFMLVGALERRQRKYVIRDVRVLNPPSEAAQDSIQAWSFGSAWYEAKSVSADGRSLAFAGTLGDSLNLDWFTMDLTSGLVTRLTRDGDWDEGGQMFPGERYMTGGSSRGSEVTAALGAMPRPPFFDFAIIGAVTNHYIPRSFPLVPDRARRSRLEQHVLDRRCADPELGLTAVELSEEGFVGNGGGGTIWSSDGTRFLNGERREDEPSTSRLSVVTIVGAEPFVGEPAPMVIPTWAPRLRDLPEPRPWLRDRTITGPEGGTVTVSVTGDMLAGIFEARYEGYVVSGCARLDGVQRASVLGALVADLEESFTLSGCLTGWSEIDVFFADVGTFGRATTVLGDDVHDRVFGHLLR